MKSKLFFRCGCGCVVIPLVDPATVETREDFRYIMVDSCERDWTDSFPTFALGAGHVNFNNIKAIDGSEGGDWVSTEQEETLCDAINHRCHEGHKFEMIQNILGVKRER